MEVRNRNYRGVALRNPEIIDRTGYSTHFGPSFGSCPLQVGGRDVRKGFI